MNGGYDYGIAGSAVDFYGNVTPIREVGRLTPDSAGNLTGTSAVSINGSAVRRTLTGTYSIDSDGSGSATLYPSWGPPIDIAPFISESGLTVEFVVTDSGSTLSGTMTAGTLPSPVGTAVQQSYEDRASHIVLGLFAKACSQDQPTFSADVNVVSILATVRDKSGRIIKDRDMDDFVLFEDGAPQKIRYFSRETDLPLTVGLLRVAASAHEAVLNNQTLTERVKALAPGIGNIVEVEDAQMYITGRRERELAAAVEEIGRHASGVRVFVP